MKRVIEFEIISKNRNNRCFILILLFLELIYTLINIYPSIILDDGTTAFHFKGLIIIYITILSIVIFSIINIIQFNTIKLNSTFKYIVFLNSYYLIYLLIKIVFFGYSIPMKNLAEFIVILAIPALLFQMIRNTEVEWLKYYWYLSSYILILYEWYTMLFSGRVILFPYATSPLLYFLFFIGVEITRRKVCFSNLIVLTINMLLILFSGSRTMTVISVGLLIGYFLNNKRKVKTLLYLLLIIVVVTIGLYFLGPKIISNGLIKIARTIRNFYSGGISLGERDIYQEAALVKIKEAPIFGNGWRSFIKLGLYEHSKRIISPHSTYLAVLLDFGLTGFILSFFLIFSLVKKAIISGNHVFLGFLIGYLISASFGEGFGIVYPYDSIKVFNMFNSWFIIIYFINDH